MSSYFVRLSLSNCCKHCPASIIVSHSKMDSPSLPKILCLHGAGSSGAIFKCQTRNIQASMRNRFEFVFADAPFESSIGPGMSPTFNDSGPFYRWHAGESQSHHLCLSSKEQERERDAVRNYLKDILTTNRGTDFVGVMAFSTGCNIATGLLLERQGLEELWGECPSFQFALLFCGTRSASLTTLLPTSWTTEESGPLLTVMQVPSVHIHGLRDPYLLQSRKLFKDTFSSGGNSVCIEFPCGHCIPGRKGDLKKIEGAMNSMISACT